MATITATCRLRWAALLLGLVLVVPALCAPELTINGYVQGRATNAIGNLPATSPRLNFDASRFYLILNAKVDENVSARVTMKQTMADTNTINLLEAYGQYTKGDMNARLGLISVPFGYENPLGSSQLITLERSAISMDLIYSYVFDRGVSFSFVPKDGLNVSVAAVNGQTYKVAKDTDQTTNGAARVSFIMPICTVGASAYIGKLGGANVQRYGVDLKGAMGPLMLIAEGIQAKDGGVKKNGGYATLAAKLPVLPIMPYARYDVYNGNVGTPGSYFQRATVGGIYQINPTSKFTVEYQMIPNNYIPSSLSLGPTGQLAAQYQVAF